jgi:hypothetical protein
MALGLLVDELWRSTGRTVRRAACCRDAAHVLDTRIGPVRGEGPDDIGEGDVPVRPDCHVDRADTEGTFARVPVSAIDPDFGGATLKVVGASHQKNTYPCIRASYINIPCPFATRPLVDC